MVVLVTIIIALLFVALGPSREDPEEKRKLIQALVHCDRHEWEEHPSGYEDSYYLMCKKCKYLPGCDSYKDY